MAARLADVAAAAGVSISTVSKALHGADDVRRETRQRVEAVARDLGYRVNGAARQLREGHSRTIGLLTTESIGARSIGVLLGAEEGFGGNDFSILVGDARGDPIRERHHIGSLIEHGVEGIIVLSDSTDPRAPLSEDVQIPVVYAFGPSMRATDSSVVPDEREGTTLAVRHLLDLGRRNIAHISGPLSYQAARLRSAVTREVLAAAGLELAGGRAYHGGWNERCRPADTSA